MKNKMKLLFFFIGVFIGWYSYPKFTSTEDVADVVDDFRYNTTYKCYNILNHIHLTCSQRVHLLVSYNKLRNKIAKGEYNGHPTIGNMIRVKWLLSAEEYIEKQVRKCDSSILPEWNVSFIGDPYKKDFGYTCDIFYKHKLFQEWTYDEINNYLIEASFQNNYFRDFDANDKYLRYYVEGIGCSIVLDTLGIGVVRAFMGCGYCYSEVSSTEIYDVRPCSQCLYSTNPTNVIRTNCDYYFRSLCVARFSDNITETDSVESHFFVETKCDVQAFMIKFEPDPIPRTLDISSSLFLKFTYIVPLLTIGSFLYYMRVIKKQEIFKISLPLTFHMIRKTRMMRMINKFSSDITKMKFKLLKFNNLTINSVIFLL